MRTTTRLSEVLRGPRISLAMGAHDAMGARLVQECGFEVVWSSGLEISTSCGLPDANILSPSENLQITARMARSVDIPVLADCDSGYGNAMNVFHLVREHELQGIAGICIEDKTFPKLNSFANGGQQLAPVADFVAKIKAATEARHDPDFVIVARIEALIAGAGMTEAIRRAEAYERAGADALLIHSKAPDPGQVFAFRENYRGRLPVTVVPTAYPHVTVRELQERGFALTIYANHGLRSAIRAMREVMCKIRDDGTAGPVEANIATLDEVLRLQDMDTMLVRQRRYEAFGEEIAKDLPAVNYQMNHDGYEHR